MARDAGLATVLGLATVEVSSSLGEALNRSYDRFRDPFEKSSIVAEATSQGNDVFSFF